MGSQGVGLDLVTKRQQQVYIIGELYNFFKKAVLARNEVSISVLGMGVRLILGIGKESLKEDMTDQ